MATVNAMAMASTRRFFMVTVDNDCDLRESEYLNRTSQNLCAQCSARLVAQPRHLGGLGTVRAVLPVVVLRRSRQIARKDETLDISAILISDSALMTPINTRNSPVNQHWCPFFSGKHHY